MLVYAVPDLSTGWLIGHVCAQLFVHARFNRVHCRMTYSGGRVSFTDFKVVLDNRVYSGMEGRWHDLLNRLKWDVIKSVLKSVAGLQGRKFKELMPDVRCIIHLPSTNVAKSNVFPKKFDMEMKCTKPHKT